MADMNRRVILDLELTLQLCQLRKRSLQEVLRGLDALADQPLIPGKLISRDDSGRIVHHQTLFHWRFSYWEDAPVNELRVLKIERDS